MHRPELMLDSTGTLLTMASGDVSTCDAKLRRRRGSILGQESFVRATNAEKGLHSIPIESIRYGLFSRSCADRRAVPTPQNGSKSRMFGGGDDATSTRSSTYSRRSAENASLYLNHW